jgi:hypothetical protein
MSKRYITLPNGNRCGLGVYAKAWRQLITLAATKPRAQVDGFGHFSEGAAEILRALRYGMHDRINRHVPGFERGRKWDDQWQRDTARAARDLNSRVCIHWLPAHLRDRFAHRIAK